MALACAASAITAAPAGAAASTCPEPGSSWAKQTPAQQGMDAAKLQDALDYGSTNLGFASWALASPIGPTGYDPNVPGEYEVRLTVSELDYAGLVPVRGADIASTDILVRAVPEPASAALLGSAVLGLFVVRRRRK